MKIKHTAKEWYKIINDRLKAALGESREVETFTFQLLEEYVNYTLTSHIINERLGIRKARYEELMKATDQVANHTPIQYLIGHVTFAGCKLDVNPHVLIPRVETQEMVYKIGKDFEGKTPSLLDIGTGSGCIAIALASWWKGAKVTAIDISESALTVARHNAAKNKVPITFLALDILQDPLPAEQWDLIVSNPPYVPLQEKSQMHLRVTQHEPAQALFVPNDAPLLFYEKIAQLATKHLTDNGRLYTEIHERFADQVKALYLQMGLGPVTIAKDLHGKPRWIESGKP